MCGGPATHFNYGGDSFAMSGKSTKPKVRGRGDTRFGVGSWSQALAVPFYFLCVIAVAGSSGLLKSLRYWLGDWTWPFIVVIFGGALLCACIGAKLGASEKRKTQTLRDAEATMSGSRALYLRTFFSDTKIQFPNPYVEKAFGVSFDLTTLDGVMLPGEVFVGPRAGALPHRSPSRWKPGYNRSWPDLYVRCRMAGCREAGCFRIRRDRNSADNGIGSKDQRLAGDATIWEMEHLVQSGRIECAVVIMPPRLR